MLDVVGDAAGRHPERDRAGPQSAGPDPAGAQGADAPGDLTCWEAIALVRRATGAAIAPHVAQVLLDATGADPEALLEAVASLAPAQLAGRSLLPDPLPPTPAVLRAVGPRLDALGPSDRALLLIAAVCVVDSTDVLLRAGRTDLDAVLGAPVVSELHLVAGHARVVDPRVRAVVHGLATPAMRTDAHRRLREVHEADGAAHLAIWHRGLASLAGDPDVAPGLLSVADRLLDAGHAATAQRVAREALSHADDATRPWALEVAGRAALHAGHVEDAAEHLREARQTSSTGDRDADRLHALGLVALTLATGHVPGLPEEETGPASRAAAAVLLAGRGETARARRLVPARPVAPAAAPAEGPQGPDVPVPPDDALAAATIDAVSAWVALLDGDPGPAAELGPTRPGAPRTAEEVTADLLVTGVRVTGLAARSRIEEARALVMAAVEALPRTRTGVWPSLVCQDGHPVPALATPAAEAYLRLAGALVEVAAGDLPAAMTALEGAACEVPVVLPLGGLAAVVAGRVAVLRDGRRGVLAEVLEALAPVPVPVPVRTGLLVDRGMELLLNGSPAAARTLLSLAEEASCALTARLPRVDATLLTGMGLGSTGGPGRPEGPAGARAAPCTAVPLADLACLAHGAVSPLDRGLARLALGARHDGERDAVEHLGFAAGLLEEAGALAVARFARVLLTRHLTRQEARAVVGGRPGTAQHHAYDGVGSVPAPVAVTPGWAEPLTEREREVARVVAQGASNRDAAQRLYVSVRTVEVHLTSIFRKLGIRSRVELAVLVERGDPAPAVGDHYGISTTRGTHRAP